MFGFQTTTSTALLALVLLTTPGCTSDQIVLLETERDALKAQINAQEVRVEALKIAVAQANQIGDQKQKEQLESAVKIIQADLEASEKKLTAIETTLTTVTRPEDLVEGAGDVIGAIIPPPFDGILPLITAAIAGEIVRRRKNSQIKSVAKNLELAGAVSIPDPEVKAATVERMGKLNKLIDSGREDAEKEIKAARKVMAAHTVGTATSSASNSGTM